MEMSLKEQEIIKQEKEFISVAICKNGHYEIVDIVQYWIDKKVIPKLKEVDDNIFIMVDIKSFKRYGKYMPCSYLFPFKENKGIISLLIEDNYHMPIPKGD